MSVTVLFKVIDIITCEENTPLMCFCFFFFFFSNLERRYFFHILFHILFLNVLAYPILSSV